MTLVPDFMKVIRFNIFSGICIPDTIN